MRTAAALRRRSGVGLAVGAAALTRAPSDPGVVNYAVLGKGSVGNIVGAPMRFESTFTEPFQSYLGRRPGVQQLGRHRAARGVRRSRPGVVQRRRRPGVGDRRRRTSSSRPSAYSPPTTRPTGPSTGSSTGRSAARARPRRCTWTTSPPRCGRSPADRANGDRRRLGEAGGRHRPALLHHDPPAGERSAAGESLPIRQRRPCGERAGRRDAEHAGAVATGTFWVPVTDASCENRGTLSVSSGRWSEGRRCVPRPGGIG